MTMTEISPNLNIMRFETSNHGVLQHGKAMLFLGSSRNIHICISNVFSRKL